MTGMRQSKIRLQKEDSLLMKTIGITGGVGAGKSQILTYLEENYSCRVLRADEVAHLLEEPHEVCYEKIVQLLGREILSSDDTIDKKKMAQIIFSDQSLLEQVNAIIHPAVKKYVISQIEKEREIGKIQFFFLEAALLIEDHYDEILDEMWYIHTDAKIREKRLMESRHYSAQKVADIMRGQLSEDDFRRHCNVEIINNGDLNATYEQIQKIMGELV